MNKNNSRGKIGNTQLKDQLQLIKHQVKQTEKGEALKKEAQPVATRNDYAARPSGAVRASSNQKTTPKGHTEVFVTGPKDLSLRAALAIASNLALSHIYHVFQLQKPETRKKFMEQLAAEAQSLQALVQQESPGADNSSPTRSGKTSPINLPNFSKYRANFELCWQQLMRPLSDYRRPYYSQHERWALIWELIVLTDKLRNYFSHIKPEYPDLNEDQFAAFNLLGKARLNGFLDRLHDEAQTRCNACAPRPLIDHEKGTYHLHAVYGASFVFSLWLTRSQQHRLLQEVQARALDREKRFSRRQIEMLSFYARPDSYSFVQKQTEVMLISEIFTYLSIPPVVSKAGQELAKQLEEKRKLEAKLVEQGQKEDIAKLAAVAPFRRQSKHLHYALRVLDELKLLPAWQFAGQTQYLVDQAAMTEADLAAEDNDLEPVWQADTSNYVELAGVHNPQRTKLRYQRQYGRNHSLAANQRFVYEQTSGQLHVCITLDQQTVQGLIRDRDFCNLVFYALDTAGPKNSELITRYAFNWLQNYRNTLNQQQAEIASLKTPVSKVMLDDTISLKHCPRQFRQALQNQQPGLFERLEKHIEARIDYLHKAKAAHPKLKRDEQGRKPKPPKSNWPRHQKVHFLLKVFIRHLNAESRQTLITQGAYRRLQQLLLNYKGTADIGIIQRQELDDYHDPAALSPKLLFWQELHKTYTPATVEGGKTHPFWEFCLLEGENGRKNLAGLDSLFSHVLGYELKQMQAMQSELATIKNNPTALAQLAARLQVSLREAQTNAAGQAKVGLAKSLADASANPVLPSALCQRALETPEQTQQRLASNYPNSLPGLGKSLREAASRRQLLMEFYEGAETTVLTILNGQSRKQAEALLDWHTRDKLCLLLAERLVQACRLPLDAGPVSAPLTTGLTQTITGKGPDGNPRSINLSYSDAMQSQRQWLSWPQPKLQKALLWHFAEGENIQVKILPEWVARYQSRCKKIVEAVFEFEQRAYENASIKASLKTVYERDKYVNFEALLKAWRQHKGEIKDDNGGIKAVRNLAMHDALPEPKYIHAAYGSKEVPLRLDQLGQNVIQILKNI